MHIRKATTLFAVIASLSINMLISNVAVASLFDKQSETLPDKQSNTTQNTKGTLTLKQALQSTLDNNPELNLYPLYLRKAEADLQQADTYPVPEGEIEISKDEASLTLSQSFELGKKRTRRMGFSNAKQQQLQAEFAITRLDALAETSRRFYQLLALQKQSSVLETRIGQEKRALTIINQRANAGAVLQADVANMALRLARSKNTLEQLRFSIDDAKSYLALMWLGTGNDINHISGNLANLPTLPNEEQLAERINNGLEQLPDYQLQAALLSIAESQLRLAQASGQADFNLGFGITHDRNTDDQSLILTASMPLNFLSVGGNPNRGRINSAQAQQQVSLEQVESKRQELKLALARIQQNLIKNIQLAKRINTELLPLAVDVLSSTQKAYRQGQYRVSQWIDAQNQVFNLEHDLINSHVRIFNQVLELERTLGQSIVSDQ